MPTNAPARADAKMQMNDAVPQHIPLAGRPHNREMDCRRLSAAMPDQGIVKLVIMTNPGLAIAGAAGASAVMEKIFSFAQMLVYTTIYPGCGMPTAVLRRFFV